MSVDEVHVQIIYDQKTTDATAFPAVAFFISYSTSKTWFLGPGQNTMALPGKEVSGFSFFSSFLTPDT
jgi:hypothetical protein